jgi:molybdopterin converting factor small subunit
LTWITAAASASPRACDEAGERVKILFFGKLGETIGREVDVEPPGDSCTVAELRRLLGRRYPAAEDDLAKSNLRACVDDIIVGEQFVVGPDARVEFFPPLSGG